MQFYFSVHFSVYFTSKVASPLDVISVVSIVDQDQRFNRRKTPRFFLEMQIIFLSYVDSVVCSVAPRPNPSTHRDFFILFAFFGITSEIAIEKTGDDIL